jgi:hypothetical protein
MWHLWVNHKKESCPFQWKKQWLYVLNDSMNDYNKKSIQLNPMCEMR